jgi:hypothetical protein
VHGWAEHLRLDGLDSFAHDQLLKVGERRRDLAIVRE